MRTAVHRETESEANARALEAYSMKSCPRPESAPLAVSHQEVYRVGVQQAVCGIALFESEPQVGIGEGTHGAQFHMHLQTITRHAVGQLKEQGVLPSPPLSGERKETVIACLARTGSQHKRHHGTEKSAVPAHASLLGFGSLGALLPLGR